MGTPAAAMTPTASAATTPAFWERLWRSAGLQFVGLFVVAYVIYGQQPRVGAPADALVAFYGDGRAGILIAAIVFGMALLNLLWFVAALRTTLADAGRDGWGSAATAASAALAALLVLLVALPAVLAFSPASAADPVLASALNDFVWVLVVLTSFPRAMLVMAGAFGLWRAHLISNRVFAAGVTAVVLVLLGGTTWLAGGFWAPDGAYSRFVSPLVCIAWVLVVSRVLLARSPATRAAW